MSLSDITSRQPVLKAIAEYDQLGEEVFLQKYGFERSRTYWLLYEGRWYASKAIIGCAHGFAHHDLEPWTSNDFTGGRHTAVKKLEELGFTIVVLSPNDGFVSPDDGFVSPDDGDEEEFNPTDIKDARKKIRVSINARRGQVRFRRNLIEAYDGRCAITGCQILDVLEAAHIFPYRGPVTNEVTNGLLLRADLHTLFDCGLMAIDSEKMTVLVSPKLQNSEYAAFNGTRLRAPENPSQWPNRVALDMQRKSIQGGV
ncbi:MAG: HNH endonuclease signature motif containing protein [Gammaproteobacteria bacterium]|nr:HNH endonuclease signature motif containing protein [Gammaproteobacteria bacterium]